MQRINFASGAPMEEKVGYSRAVRIGDRVLVGGTTATNPDGTVEAPGDAYLQSKIVFQRMEEVLGRAGATLADVVSIHIFITDVSLAKDSIRAYSEFFKPYKPLCTMVGISALFRPEQIVEIEAEAIIGSAPKE